MNATMRDLTSVVLAAREAPLCSVPDIRRMVREADEPELMAAYERIDHLEGLLASIRCDLQKYGFDVPVIYENINAIDDALDPHRVVLS